MEESQQGKWTATLVIGGTKEVPGGQTGLSPPGGPDATLPGCPACLRCKGELLEGNRQVMPPHPGVSSPLAFRS